MRKLKVYLDTSVISHLIQEDVPEKMADTGKKIAESAALKTWRSKFDLPGGKSKIKNVESTKRCICHITLDGAFFVYIICLMGQGVYAVCISI